MKKPAPATGQGATSLTLPKTQRDPLPLFRPRICGAGDREASAQEAAAKVPASGKNAREFTGAVGDRTGNLPSLPGIFVDYSAPIFRNQPEGRELMTARWGMPSPAFALSDPGVTNVRNWRRWLAIENRCAVPFTSFSKDEVLLDGSRPPVWFALDETRPLAFFAGIWTRWTSVRKVKEGETTNDIFAFLTTEPNREVGAINPKAKPVILTSQRRSTS